jgi:diguanylate cyclase (GGDEF)-like protein
MVLEDLRLTFHLTCKPPHTMSQIEHQPPIPDNDEERLQALYYYDILDTRPEEAFDRLTDIARTVFDVDMAGISLVDQDRQWFKSCQGFDDREQSRNVSFCAHAILRDDIMKVPDTHKDPRFQDNPLVKDGLKIRSYYGAPLITEEGFSLGSFCILDHEPRDFSDEQLEILALLRDQAVLQIQNRSKSLRIDNQARTDYLTGLPNRTEFLRNLDELIMEADETNQDLAFYKVHLDNIERANDVFGQETADQILKTLGDRLENCEEEITSGRLLGMSFGVIRSFDHAKDRQVHHFAEHLHDVICEELELGETHFKPVCRMGYALYPYHSRDRDELFRMAGEALRNTSREEGNRLNMYASDFELADWKEVNLESDFRKALIENSFELHYQPFVSLETGELTGMEALIRWQLPEHGYISPPTIINIARNQGAMARLGQWVLRTACRDTVQWNDGWARPLTVSVNVSAVEFLDTERYVGTVRQLIQDTGIRSELLQLEITETEMMEDISITADQMNDLKDLDVRLAIDDFGTGYSSLQYLASLPVDVLKIDQSFVWSIEDDKQQRELLQSIIQMADRQDMQTLAEGVETDRQRELLKEMGCDVYQGYYTSKPLPAEEFASFVTARQ